MILYVRVGHYHNRGGKGGAVACIINGHTFPYLYTVYIYMYINKFGFISVHIFTPISRSSCRKRSLDPPPHLSHLFLPHPSASLSVAAFAAAGPVVPSAAAAAHHHHPHCQSSSHRPSSSSIRERMPLLRRSSPAFPSSRSSRGRAQTKSVVSESLSA